MYNSSVITTSEMFTDCFERIFGERLCQVHGDLAGLNYFTLARFLQDGFELTDDQQTADLIALLLSYSGSDLPTNAGSKNQFIAPGDFSQDAPRALGKQLLLTNDTTDLNILIARATTLTGRLDLIVKSFDKAAPRGWLYSPLTKTFRSDAAGALISRANLFTNASFGKPLLFTLVPKGAGERLGLDRDLDGIADFDEVLGGTDPADPASGPNPLKMAGYRIEGAHFLFTWNSPLNRRYNILTKATISGDWSILTAATAVTATTTNSVPLQNSAAYFKLEVLP